MINFVEQIIIHCFEMIIPLVRNSSFARLYANSTF